ncbi:M3 family metallopeptidase [Oerskovia sp. M15]
MLASRLFNEGFGTTEYLAAALLDQAWHQLSPEQVPTSVEEVLPFEAAALDAAGVGFAPVPRATARRTSTTCSGRLLGGYYSYIWSEVLDADTVTWFEENGGLTRANGDAFRARLLERGGSVDPMVAFADLRAVPGDRAAADPPRARRVVVPSLPRQARRRAR